MKWKLKFFSNNIVSIENNVFYIGKNFQNNNIKITDKIESKKYVISKAYDVEIIDKLKSIETKTFHLIFENELNINFEIYKNQLFKKLNLKDYKDLMVMAKNENETHIFLILKKMYEYDKDKDEEKFIYEFENSKKLIPIIETKLSQKMLDIIKKDENSYNSFGLCLTKLINTISNLIFLTKPINELIDDGDCEYVDIRKIIDARNVYSNISLKIPDELEKENIWLYGPANIRKLDVIKKVYNNDFYLKELNDDWDSYDNQNVVVLNLPYFYDKEKLNYINKWSDPSSFYIKKIGIILKIGFSKFIVISDNSIKETLENLENEKFSKLIESKFKSIYYNNMKSLNEVAKKIKNPKLI